MREMALQLGKYRHWRLEVDDSGIGWLWFDTDGRSVNILHKQALAELDAITQGLAKAKDIGGLVLASGKPSGFCYGADIREFAEFASEDATEAHLTQVHASFARLAGLPYPSVALIDGVAVGGGLELALTCDAIIASTSPKTQLGFPEVKLGLMPGFGGSGRAYHRVGAAPVLDLMLTGDSITSKQAAKLGLVDGLVSHGDGLATAGRAWLGKQKGRKPKPTPTPKPSNIEAVIADATAKHLSRTRPDHTPAPFAIIDHVRAHAADPLGMAEAEKTMFPVLLASQASQGLRRRFDLSDQLRKLGRGSPPIQHLHVIGAGVMGGDIAAIAALLGVTTSISDSNDAALEKAHARAQVLFARRLADSKQQKAASARLTLDKNGSGLAQADLIIEAVAEDVAIKQQVLRHAESQAKPTAVLASNTSSIPLEELAVVLSHPTRLIGMHFFNPAPVMPLVEVIAHQAKAGTSSEASLLCGLGFCQQLGKMPLPCKSAPGFLVNRAVLPYVLAAIAQNCDGTACDKLDEAMRDFGMPMGPIELADQIGLDVLLAASKPLGAMPPTVEKVLTAHIKAGRLGRKSGEGFYKWEGNNALRAAAQYPSKDLTQIAESLLQPMLAACAAAVAEGVVINEDMADAAMIFGAGFPAFRGGPLFWAASKK